MIAALADEQQSIGTGGYAGVDVKASRRRKTAVARGCFRGERGILPERVAMSVQGEETAARTEEQGAIHQQRHTSPLTGADTRGPLDAAIGEAEGFHSIARGCIEKSI